MAAIRDVSIVFGFTFIVIALQAYTSSMVAGISQVQHNAAESTWKYDYHLLLTLTSKCCLPFIVLFVFGVVQLIRFGNRNDYLFIALGSPLCVAAIMGYAMLPELDRGRKSWSLFLVALSVLLPYFFLCYLIFYRGFWRMRTLLTHFSFEYLAARLLFVVLGWYTMKWLSLVTEYVKRVARPGRPTDATESL